MPNEISEDRPDKMSADMPKRYSRRCAGLDVCYKVGVDFFIAGVRLGNVD